MDIQLTLELNWLWNIAWLLWNLTLFALLAIWAAEARGRKRLSWIMLMMGLTLTSLGCVHRVTQWYSLVAAAHGW